jgi:hypothetical protein
MRVMKMARLKIIQGADKTDVEIPEDMLIANDDQVKSYIRETLHRDLPDNIVIERTAEAIVCHPEAVYG